MRKPSSRCAFTDEANIFFLPMRTASTVARGSRSKDSPRDNLIKERKRHRNCMRNLHLRRRKPRNRRHIIENLLQSKILAAQNIPLARSAQFQSSAVRSRHFRNINKIQPGIHIRRKFLVQKIHNNTTLWASALRPAIR